MPRRREAKALTGPREGQVGNILSFDGDTVFVQFNDCRRGGRLPGYTPDVHMLLPGEWKRITPTRTNQLKV